MDERLGAGQIGGFESEEGSKAESALNLFQSLQTLMTLNYYQVSDATKADLYRSDSLYVNETIPLPASDERIIRFKDFEIIKGRNTEKIYTKALSDGEHQLIHTIGLNACSFATNPLSSCWTNRKIHLNPDWRRPISLHSVRLSRPMPQRRT